MPGLSAKQPKTVAGCVAALKEVIRYAVTFTDHFKFTHISTHVLSLFGIQVTPPTPVLKVLPKIFAHTDKTVRAEGTQLVHSLYQYMGAGIEGFLSDLKPVQVKELKEAFENMEKEGKGRGSLKPERLTRVAAREAEEREAAGGDDDGEAPPEEGKQFSSYYNLKSQTFRHRRRSSRSSNVCRGSKHRAKAALGIPGWIRIFEMERTEGSS